MEYQIKYMGFTFDESNNTSDKCGYVTWNTQLTLSDMLNLMDMDVLIVMVNHHLNLLMIRKWILSIQGILYLYLVSPDPLLFSGII